MTAHLAHRNDPETSHDAAARVGEFKPDHQQIILNTLAQARNGYTAHEIAAHSNLEMVQVNRRLHELGKAGSIIRSDEKRATPSGRKAHVWHVAGVKQFSFEGME